MLLHINKFFTHCTKTIQKKVKTWLYRRHPYYRVSYFAQNKYSMMCLWPAIFSYIRKDALSMDVNQINGFVFFNVFLWILDIFCKKNNRKYQKNTNPFIWFISTTNASLSIRLKITRYKHCMLYLLEIWYGVLKQRCVWDN